MNIEISVWGTLSVKTLERLAQEAAGFTAPTELSIYRDSNHDDVWGELEVHVSVPTGHVLPESDTWAWELLESDQDGSRTLIFSHADVTRLCAGLVRPALAQIVIDPARFVNATLIIEPADPSTITAIEPDGRVTPNHHDELQFTLTYEYLETPREP